MSDSCEHEWTKAENVLVDDYYATRYRISEWHRTCKKCGRVHGQVWGINGANGKNVYWTKEEYTEPKK